MLPVPSSRWSRIRQCSGPTGLGSPAVRSHQSLPAGTGRRGELAKGADGLTWLGHRRHCAVQAAVVWKDYLHSLIFHGTRKHSCLYWRGFIGFFCLIYLCVTSAPSPALSFAKHAFWYLSLHLVISELCLRILIMFLQSDRHQVLEQLEVGLYGC